MSRRAANFKDWVLVIAGNIFIASSYYGPSATTSSANWGELFGHIAAGAGRGLIYANNQTSRAKGFWIALRSN